MKDTRSSFTRFPVAENVAAMHESSTLKAAQLAMDLRDRRFDVVDLSVGEPDFDTPEFVKELAWEGLQRGLTKYTAISGMKMFKEAIASYFGEQFNTDFPPSAVAATCGGKQALFNAACAILDPGD